MFNSNDDITNNLMNYATYNYNNDYNNKDNALLNILNLNNNNQLNQLTNMSINTNSNSNNTTLKTNIFFVNGMDNNYRSALDSSKLISNLTNRQVGIIVNNSGGKLSDLTEFLETDLSLRHVLTSEFLQELDDYNLQNSSRSLAILHSAGNNDLLRVSQTLQLTNTKLNNTIDVISVGSPISKNKLESQFDKTGINFIWFGKLTLLKKQKNNSPN